MHKTNCFQWTYQIDKNNCIMHDVDKKCWLIEWEPKQVFLWLCLLLRHKNKSTLFILGMREQLQLLVNLVNVIFGHIFEECAIFAIRLIFIAAKDCILSTQFLVWKNGWNRHLFSWTIQIQQTKNYSLCLHEKTFIRVAYETN